MRVSHIGSRAIGFGLVFAMAGLTFAISTSFTASDDVAVTSRQVGSSLPLRFTTPRVLGTNGLPLASVEAEYDLGDALFGSAIARYITAQGGVKPYRFTSADSKILDPKTNLPVRGLALAIANTSSTLTLGLSGALSGKTPASIATNARTFTNQPGLHFHVTLADAYTTNTSSIKGTTSNAQEGNFNIALFDSSATGFRFAVDTLPAGLLAAPYFAKIDVLAGRGPVTISALSVTNKSTGAALKLDDDLGLFLGTDGSIYGRPLSVGTYTIVAHAVDAASAIARSRKNPNVFNQSFDLVVGDNRVTSSDTMTQSCVVQGDTSRSGFDTLRLKGYINVLGQDQFSLANSDFAFQLGSIGFSGRLDKHGKLTAKNADGTHFSVNVNAASGTINIRAMRGSFIRGFDLSGVTDGKLVLRPLKIIVGSAVNSAEVLQFASSVSGTRYTFNFAQGHSGANATGGFQIVSVRGRDDVTLTGLPGDAWRVGFVAQPRLDSVVKNPSGLHEGLDNIVSVNVRIGGGFSQVLAPPPGTVSTLIGAGPRIHFAGTLTDGIQSFNFNTISSKGSINTRSLVSTTTGIPTAATSLKSNNIFFPLGVDIVRLPASANFVGDATFIGEHARRIFGFGTQYTDKPSKRQTPGIF